MREPGGRSTWAQALHRLQIPCPSFVGREEELLWLQQRLQIARQGQGAVLFVSGEAGIGKSRLLAELAARGQQAEACVLQGRCSLFEAALPYGPFIEALRGAFQGRAPRQIGRTLGPYAPEAIKLLPELGQLLPGVRQTPPLSPPEEKSRLFESSYQVLRQVAVEAPLILALEDIHWADPASLELLHFIAKRLRHDHWLVIATYRPEELQHADRLAEVRQDLLRARLAEELTMRPLSAPETGQLVQAVLGADTLAPDALRAWIAHYGEGNPFFTEEIVRSIVEAGDDPIAKFDSAALSSMNVPTTIRQAIAARLAQLSPDARTVLATAAVLGRTFESETLQQASGLGGEAFGDAFMSLLSLHLVRTEPAPLRYGFRHHLIREVVLQSLAPDVRRGLHERVGMFLETQVAGRPAPLLAYHFAQAADRDRTARYALAAARDASLVYAHDEAARYYAMALDAQPASPSSSRMAAAEGMGDALFHAGQLERCIGAYETMRACARAIGTRRDLARACRKIGRVQNEASAGAGLPAFEEGLAVAAEAGDALEEAMIREQMAKVMFLTGRYAEGVTESEAALAAAVRAEDIGAQGRCYKSLALNRMSQGRAAESAPFLEKALALARKANDLEGELKALNDIGFQAIRAAAFEDARAALAQACRLVDKIGSVPTLLLPLVNVAQLSAIEGRWDEAEAVWLRSTALLSQGGRHYWPFATAAARLARLYALRGQFDRAETLLREALAAADAATDSWGLAVVHHARAEVELHRENASAAKTLLERALEFGKAPVDAKVEAHLLLSEACLRLGQAEEARRWLEAAGSVDEANRFLAPRVLRLRGMMAAQAGALDDALSLYREGLKTLVTASQPYQEALLHHQIGVCLLRRNRKGDHRAARAALGDALSILDRLGAAPDGTAVRRTLRRVRGRLPVGQALTRREQEVLALLADGLSNTGIAARLYLSERTVEVHVSHILGKLGVENRAHAAAWAVKHNLI